MVARRFRWNPRAFCAPAKHPRELRSCLSCARRYGNQSPAKAKNVKDDVNAALNLLPSLRPAPLTPRSGTPNHQRLRIQSRHSKANESSSRRCPVTPRASGRTRALDSSLSPPTSMDDDSRPCPRLEVSTQPTTTPDAPSPAPSISGDARPAACMRGCPSSSTRRRLEVDDAFAARFCS